MNKAGGRGRAGSVFPLRKRALLCALAVLAGASLCPTAGPCQQTDKPPVLTQVDQIRKLSPKEAAQGYRARLRGVVTYCDLPRGDLFLKDPTGGIYVD
ncbi:MAG TPA: hypothetical protein VFM21_05155, partial [Terriglobia bacterium]|nr:hypothetical protein [Terriglobia bacterium]